MSMFSPLRPLLLPLLWAGLAAVLSPAIARARAYPYAGEITLTFDDLPAISLVEREDYVEDLNRRLLAGLQRHHIPATGFVVEGKLDEMDRPRQIALLRLWLASSMQLGNHTFSHENPSQWDAGPNQGLTGATDYTADIARGEQVTRPLMAEFGRTLRWFRAPNLEIGHPEPVRAAIAAWLGTHGYAMAPVTINASDWEFAEPYDIAIAQGNVAEQQRLRAAYLAYTRRTVAWYLRATQAVFGHGIAQVMLLHATRLNADSIDDLAGILRAQHLRPVTLDRAMADPVYRLPYYPTKEDGVDWIERWSDLRHKDLPWARWREVPDWVAKAYDRVDTDRQAPPPGNIPAESIPTHAAPIAATPPG